MRFVDAYWKKAGFLFISLLVMTSLHAQQKIIKGYVKDALSDERIPFASIQFVHSGLGKLSDSAGGFIFRFNNWPADTILATYVGYKDAKLYIGQDMAKLDNRDTLEIVIQMERGNMRRKWL